MTYVPIESTEYPGWYEIPDVVGYLASEDGRILRLTDGYITTGGFAGHYFKILIHGRSTYVHRLVVSAFYGAIPKNLVCNHKDGNKLNNHKDNLEICTASDNIRHAYKNNLNRSGNEKRIWVYDALLKSVKTFNSIEKFVATDSQFSRSGINNAINDQRLYKNRFYIDSTEILCGACPSLTSQWILKKCPFSDKVVVYTHLTPAAKSISVSNEVLQTTLTNGGQYLRRYLFKPYNSTENWLSYSECVLKFNQDCFDILVYDISSKTVFIFRSTEDVAAFFKISVRLVYKRLHRRKHKLTETLFVKYFKDPTPIRITDNWSV